jgi:hypothetical protein
MCTLSHLRVLFVLCCAQADHPSVPETAVIGYPHAIKGEGERPQEALISDSWLMPSTVSP